ncbi:MAG: hypothetical protein ACE14L_06800 [Terriglobales bacterium]
MVKFMFGLFCGIALGMVVAPASGVETRRQLRQKAEQWKESGSEKGRQEPRAFGSDVAERMYDRAVGEE